MPKRKDLKKILVVGAGPIIIGQACEFDYSGTQACKALKDEGYKVVLINSNPATIMTDPEFADRTYIEPINEETIARIISQENIDAVLPTMGGQTALNLCIEADEKGIWENLASAALPSMIFAISNAAGFTSVSSMVCGLPCFAIRYTTSYDVVRIGLFLEIKPRTGRVSLSSNMTLFT